MIIARWSPVMATVAASLMLSQCNRTPEPVEAQPVAEPAPAPVIPAPTAMTRADLLGAVSRAGSAYAAGEQPAGADPLVGRPFAVRLPFGCNGPQSMAADGAGDGLAHWTWGPDRKTIQLSLTPGDWLSTALVSSTVGGSDWEAVEGFWIPRPWLGVETCSQVRADPLQSGQHTPSSQTVGLAAVFKSDESRVGRRNGRAYTYTVRAEGDAPLKAPANGYRAVVEGRLAAFPGGRAIRCRASSPDQRPVCIAAIELDRVAFTEAETGTVLSEWRPG
ncbi:MAG: hypothetical protein ACOH1E_10760 [Brevundimonas sp.]